ncbi:MAG: PHP domain-containing protein [Actinobacteria bacterium]|nr:MAG: PHP domain-containing protein [Actinomycetota bacterium]
MPSPDPAGAPASPAASEVDFDLQAHSLHSDGALPAAEVVERAAAAGVRLLALTDHDTVEGVEEALAAGARRGIAVVPATELSAVDEQNEDLHVLGYRIEHRDPGLLEALADFRSDRRVRAQAMADALEGLGWSVDRQALARAARAGGDRPVGRPHLAAAVAEHPANRERMRAEGLDEPSRLLEAYLIPGAPAYRPRTRPTVAEAIELIAAAGGIAVWAHPFWDIDDTGEVRARLERFCDWGLRGVEAFYPTHSAEQTRALCEEARRLDLLTTGSSDFHAPGHRLFDGFLAFSLYGCQPRLGPIAAG